MLERLLNSDSKTFDICVVGGAGHVGLPLAITFASHGFRSLIYDVNCNALEMIGRGKMPFMEEGATPLLQRALQSELLSLSEERSSVARAAAIFIVIGTPVDEFMNPSLKSVTGCIDELLPYLTDDHLVVLRSTVYPGVTQAVDRYLKSKGRNCRVAFCPERVVQGKAIEEIQRLPQIVSGTTPEAKEAAARLFQAIAPEVLRLSPIEAELVKLFSNAYRYIQFAVSNQFYLISESAGVDYYKLMEAMKNGYPRMSSLPSAGFAAGPCLFKDTMQLAAFYKNQFSLGLSAMLVNESMPMFIVDHILEKYDLHDMTVGLLGMAFKADSDDARSSLSYKLKKVVAFRAKEVLTTDPYVTTDSNLLPAEEVVERSNILILCVPHSVYRDLDLKGKIVVDVWDFWPHVGSSFFTSEPSAVRV